MISVAMTTYNGEKYLREQIDSILSQTIQNFELVVCDDCSEDATCSILEEYQKRDNRIKVYRNDKNIGFKKNFEKAISLCKGDYIALSDQDDIWMENHLEVLRRLIGNKMMACGNCLLIDGEGRDCRITYRDEELLDNLPQDELFMAYSIALFRNPFQGASMMINSVYLHHLLPIPNGVGFHDSWISLYSCFCGGFSYTSKVITKYRMHGHNITKVRLKRKKRWMEFLRTVKNPCFYDRFTMLDEIQKRTQLSDDVQNVLSFIKEVVLSSKTIWGRIKLIPFKCRYFSIIYNC